MSLQDAPNNSNGSASSGRRPNMQKTMMWCAVVMLTGCGATVQQLRTRASYDFECTETQLHVQAIDSGTRQVEGCGKRAMYVEIFNNSRHPTWMLNSDVRDVPAKSVSR
jgi:hypothetical protein